MQQERQPLRCGDPLWQALLGISQRRLVESSETLNKKHLTRCGLKGTQDTCKISCPQATRTKVSRRKQSNRMDRITCSYRKAGPVSLNKLPEQPGDLLNLLNSAAWPRPGIPNIAMHVEGRPPDLALEFLPFEIHWQKNHKNATLQTRLGYLKNPVLRPF